jgi:hypothetical protein
LSFRALQEAQDIFGVDFDYGILEAMDEDGYEEEEEEEDEYLDEEGEDAERRCCKLRMTEYIWMLLILCYNSELISVFADDVQRKRLARNKLRNPYLKFMNQVN